MLEFLASTFGYVLNFIYELVKNYGLAIILFSILVKLVMLPLSIKQQKTMKKSMKLQEKSREIQEKYKNNKEKMNQEMMELYKRENASPFSGCLTSIIQIVLLFSMFFLVRSPLTHMIKMDPVKIENYTNEIKQEAEENNQRVTYPEISLIKTAREKLAEAENIKEEKQEEVIETEEKTEVTENVETENVTEIKEENSTELDEERKADYEKMAINMNFLGVDLSNVPSEDMSNPTVYIIPGLYVISTFISIWITNNSTKKKKKENEKQSADDPMAGATKGMIWFMPIMSISIAIIAPLGLALYWLINNILMIIERLIMDIFIKDEDDEKSSNNVVEAKKIDSKVEEGKEEKTEDPIKMIEDKKEKDKREDK